VRKITTIINIYALNVRETKSTKTVLTKLSREIDSSTSAGDFSTPLSTMDRRSRQWVNETVDLNNTTDQMDVTHKHRTHHPIALDCIFFLSICEMFSSIGHMLGHKIIFNKFKKGKLIPHLFRNHN
jgi:hypothetical protein